MAESPKPKRLLRKPEVMRRTGLRLTRLHELIRAGRFPPPVRLTQGGRAVAWHEHQVDEWIDTRPPAN